MRDLNKIFLMGRLGGDPTLKATKTGIAVATFSLATSKPKPRKEEENGTTEEVASETPADAESSQTKDENDTVWHRVVVWGKQGQNCAEYLKKGQSALVEGSVRTRKYKGADGIDRFAFEVHAETVRFLGGGRRMKTEEPVLGVAEL